MKMRFLLAALSLSALAACGSYEPPPPEALNVTCEPGGRHGPTGVMDWTCTDGDGEQRLPVRSLHEVIEGAPLETGESGEP
ncbi:MAG: hypothetical protein NXI12_04095 [Alphaproteobacteria bacterium]|nr:hypothetical protein [Alphaproteobacteria bacterium]